MNQQVSMQRLGQNMPFHAPQMGPSMSPAFVFAAGEQEAPIPLTPFPAAPTPPPEPLPMPQQVVVTPAPAPASKDWVAPVAILAVVSIIVGLTA